MESALTGQELIDLKRRMEDEGASKSEMCEAAGYVSTKKDGSRRLNFTAFYEALLEAKGCGFGGSGRPGRKLGYVCKVNAVGAAIVGARYVEQLGLEVGDPFRISVGRKRIVLTRIEPADQDFESQDEEEQESDPVAHGGPGDGLPEPQAAPARELVAA